MRVVGWGPDQISEIRGQMSEDQIHNIYTEMLYVMIEQLYSAIKYKIKPQL